MRFPNSTLVETSFATAPVYLRRVVGNKIIFKPDVLSKEWECQLGSKNTQLHDLEDEGSISFDAWRRVGSVPNPKPREMLYLGVENDGQVDALNILRNCPREYLDQPQLHGWRDEALKAYEAFVRSEIDQRPLMSGNVLLVAEFLASHQVKGDDVKKALKSKGLTFSGKVVGNYMGGYDLFDASGARITFQQFLEALRSDEPVGQDTKAQITEVEC